MRTERGADRISDRPLVLVVEDDTAIGSNLERALDATGHDTGARRVTLGGTEVVMRTTEFGLLVELMSHADKVVTREDLMSRVCDEHWFGSTKTLDVYIAALRRRLGERRGDPSRITALRGVGEQVLEEAHSCRSAASRRPSPRVSPSRSTTSDARPRCRPVPSSRGRRR